MKQYYIIMYVMHVRVVKVKYPTAQKENINSNTRIKVEGRLHTTSNRHYYKGKGGRGLGHKQSTEHIGVTFCNVCKEHTGSHTA